jgi:hypothetical protein
MPRSAARCAGGGNAEYVSYAFKAPAGERLRLAEHDPGRHSGVGKKGAEKELEGLTEELAELAALGSSGATAE